MSGLVSVALNEKKTKYNKINECINDGGGQRVQEESVTRQPGGTEKGLLPVHRESTRFLRHWGFFFFFLALVVVCVGRVVRFFAITMKYYWPKMRLTNS